MPCRVTALVFLLVAAALAGCNRPPDEPVPDGETESGRVARGGASGDEADYETARFFDGPVNIVGIDQTATFDVQVPDNLSAVTGRYDPELNWIALGFTMELSGCGAYGRPALELNGGNVLREFDLCVDPEPGAQTLTWHLETGQADGRIELWGLRPRGNETA